jgi:formylglycine-generating enzyme required for sulfatase activity
MKGAGPKAPVENISWEECREFCANLCRIEGVPEGTYRLLTEPEWEYSCRAGTQDPTYIGICEIIGENNAPDLDRIAWYSGNSGVVYKEGWNSAGWPEKQYDHRRAGTQPVGLKQPNAWGLYDMLGNVWEWTADRYLPIYPPGILRDPGSPEHGSARVCRGGAWYTKPVRSRAAERYENSALYRASNLGVRIARRIPNDRLSSKP